MEDISRSNSVYTFLQIFVRGGVIITLILLAFAFGALFIHNWKLYDQTLQSKQSGGSCDSDIDDDEYFEDFDPKLKKRLLQTRRKSVTFSVCTVDNEARTFDLDQKKVPLVNVLPPVEEEKEKPVREGVKRVPIPPWQGVKWAKRATERRMSVPAVPFIIENMERVDSPWANSVETII